MLPTFTRNDLPGIISVSIIIVIAIVVAVLFGEPAKVAEFMQGNLTNITP